MRLLRVKKKEDDAQYVHFNLETSLGMWLCGNWSNEQTPLPAC